MAERPVDILLVEDSSSDEELTLYALKAQNLAYDVMVVRDGAEALDFIFRIGAYAGLTGENRPRLVLLDLKLPKVDGFEVLRILKEHPRTRTIPVVVLTSSNEERDIVESFRLGGNSYICKPVDFVQFGEVVRQVAEYWLLLNQPQLG